MYHHSNGRKCTLVCFELAMFIYLIYLDMIPLIDDCLYSFNVHTCLDHMCTYLFDMHIPTWCMYALYEIYLSWSLNIHVDWLITCLYVHIFLPYFTWLHDSSIYLCEYLSTMIPSLTLLCLIMYYHHFILDMSMLIHEITMFIYMCSYTLICPYILDVIKILMLNFIEVCLFFLLGHNIYTYLMFTCEYIDLFVCLTLIYTWIILMVLLGFPLWYCHIHVMDWLCLY